MDVDTTGNEGLQPIPGADETTLLSNVSDEFVLPPISTTGNRMKKYHNLINGKFLCRLFFSTNSRSSTNNET